MRLFSLLTPTLAGALLAMTGCAGTPVASPPAPPAPPAALPAALTVPAGQVLFLEALATGVQIYECAAKPGQPAIYEWAFRAPEAALSDSAGHVLGKHYAGPTWEAVDGSTVVGEVKARDAGPTPSAIPWLLLNAKATTGTGVFAATRSIQRLNTVGGIAPADPCSAGNVKQVVRVPYTATYDFYQQGA